VAQLGTWMADRGESLYEQRAESVRLFAVQEMSDIVQPHGVEVGGVCRPHSGRKVGPMFGNACENPFIVPT
jgi:hypothetical protein